MSQSLVKKFLGTAGVQMCGRGLSVIMGIVLARVLGPEEFGRYSFVLSLIAIAVIPTIAGVPQLLIREVANAQLEKRWAELKGIMCWAIVYIVVISFVVIFGVLLVIEFEWVRKDIGQLLWASLLLIPLRGMLSRQSAVLNGFRFPVLAQLPQGVFTSIFALLMVVTLLLIGKQLDAFILVIIQVIASLIGLLISVYFVYLKTPFEVSASKAEFQVRRWHKALLSFTLLVVISTMNNELASVFLGFLANEESIAYFKVAMQAVTLLSLGLVSINAIIGPKVARYYRQGNIEATQELLTKSVRLSVLTSIPFALLLIFFGDWVVTLLFGVKYLPAAPIISILCIGHIVNVLMGSVGLLLQMTGNEKKAVRSIIITFVITILLLLALVPQYKEIGAAVAVSFSMTICNILMGIDVYKHCKILPWIR